jgi:hypothetical protein
MSDMQLIELKLSFKEVNDELRITRELAVEARYPEAFEFDGRRASMPDTRQTMALQEVDAAEVDSPFGDLAQRADELAAQQPPSEVLVRVVLELEGSFELGTSGDLGLRTRVEGWMGARNWFDWSPSQISFEDLLGEGWNASLTLQQLAAKGRMVVVRRVHRIARPRRPLDLPLRCRIILLDGASLELATNLFDGYTAERTKELGAFSYETSTDSSEEGFVHIVHLVRETFAGPLALHFDDEPPALLFLQELSGTTKPNDMLGRAYEAIELGVGCVVVCSGRHRSSEFFQTFYRKLLHNRPIDDCLALARESAFAVGSPSLVSAMLATEGGELRLLLTRAVAESLGRVVPSPGQERRARARAEDLLEKLRREDDELSFEEALEVEVFHRDVIEEDLAWFGGGPEMDVNYDGGVYRDSARAIPAASAPSPAPAPATSAPAPVSAPEPEAPEPEFELPPLDPKPATPVPSRRAQRAASLVRDKLQAEVFKTSEAFAAVSNERFDEELHAVDVAVRAARRAAEGSAVVNAGERLLAELENDPSLAEPIEARLTQAWFTKPGSSESLRRDESLEVDVDYELAVQITPLALEQARTSASFPEQLLAGWFETRNEAMLDVRIFVDPNDFDAGSTAQALRLPVRGASDVATFELRPRRVGTARVRVCLYHQGALLQSLLATATVVVAAVGDQRGQGAIDVVIDYVAASEPDEVAELPSPVLSLFMNDAADGTHWIGVFAPAQAPGTKFYEGALFTFADEDFTKRSQALRSTLDAVRLLEPYTLALPYTLQTAEDQEKHANAIVELAREGYEKFFHFFTVGNTPEAVLAEFSKAASTPGLVSISRLKGGATTLPWAMLYDHHLDVDGNLSLCEVLRAQLAANQWEPGAAEPEMEDLGRLTQQHDLLDDPEACRAQKDCPLKDPKRAMRTVCPFGFWGFRHKIEQPIHRVTPTAQGTVPAEVEQGNFSRGAWLARASADKTKLRLAFDQALASADPHKEALNGSLPASAAAESTWDRDQVLQWLLDGGADVVYLYCDGVLHRDKLALRFGPFRISPAALGAAPGRWPRPSALILNACATVAASPERMDDFMPALRKLGAVGFIGTETPVFDKLARPFGRALLDQVLAGRTFGRALLDVRRHLLRRLNPLGLTYTLHGPANLHLHTHDGACEGCTPD